MDKTDAALKALEKQIKTVYTKAYQEMKDEAAAVLAKIEMNPDMSLAQKMALMAKYDRLNTLSNQLANTAYEANSYAKKMINNEMVNIYGINYNGDAERLGFSLVDNTAIKKILKEEENPFNMVSGLYDKVGIRNQMKGQLMSGLLKGEGINKIAQRLKNVSEKSLKDSIRIARTETTRVQNSAKMDIGEHGKELGFNMWKRWVATVGDYLPNGKPRTREDHLAMNGVEVPQDEPFVLPDGSKLMFPGDISLGAPAEQTINCRCTVVEFVKQQEEDQKDNQKNPVNIFGDYISFSKKMDNPKWDSTKSIIQDLTSEYKTKLKTVDVGSVKSAGSVQISGTIMKINSSSPDVVIHEFAHTISMKDQTKFGLYEENDFWKEIATVRRDYLKAVSDDTTKWISDYEHSSRKIDEFMAEAFTMSTLKEKGFDIPNRYGNDFTYSDKVLEIVKKYFEKK